jgi:hypothetical protein
VPRPAAARRVAGVSTVDNNLMVVLPERDFRDDVKLATAANNALTQNVAVPDTVEATAEDGNITLTGTVSYGTERAAAETAVAGLAGVRTWAEHDAVVGAALMARGVVEFTGPARAPGTSGPPRRTGREARMSAAGTAAPRWPRPRPARPRP